MSPFDHHALYELDILKHVEQDSHLSNRLAARKLGVSLKLAHEVLKRMVRKGLLHVRKVNSRRWDYFLTARGIAEKTRLTLEFLEFSMQFYREARRRSSRVCRALGEAGHHEVAFLGAGDLAEIAYLGVHEWGLSLAAVYDHRERAGFMGLPVQPISRLRDEHLPEPSCPIIVCMYDAGQPLRGGYLPAGAPRLRSLVWIFPAPAEAAVEVRGGHEKS